MALISCQECKKEISNQAPACPSCGFPLNQSAAPETVVIQKHSLSVSRTGAKWEAIGSLMVIGGVIYGIATSPNIGLAVFIGFIGFVLFIIGRFN